MSLPGAVTPEVAARHAEMLGNRVKKRFRHLRSRFSRQRVEAFRVYDRDIPEVRAAVDWYAGHAVVAEYARTQTAGLGDWLDRMGRAVADALDISVEHVHLKRRRTQPTAGPRYEKLATTDRRWAVREGELSFWVNLDDYIDTGLFLDHRKTRAMVGGMSEGRDFLNLYGYTGSFTCYAAAGGASSTTTVDRSSVYLEWMRDNLRLNGLDGAPHHAVASPVETFLHRAVATGRRWPLIVLDPPSRSTVGGPAGGGLDLRRDYRWLLEKTLAVLAPRGALFFSTNHQRLDPSFDGLGISVREITRQTVPEDFAPHTPHRAWRIDRR